MAAPSMAPTMAIPMCRSILPLMPSDSMRRKVEMPMPIQIAIMARPMVVPGCLLLWREASTPVRTEAAIMVTGQARAGDPQTDQAMAT